MELDYNNSMNKLDILSQLQVKLATNERWAVRALHRILQEQTADEQQNADVKHTNGVGFRAMDAMILTSFAQQHARRGSLSPKQMAIVHRKMPRYARQLIRLVGDEKIAAAL